MPSAVQLFALQGKQSLERGHNLGGLVHLLRYASQAASDANLRQRLDASYRQCPSIQVGDASADTRDASTRRRGHTACEHVP